MDALRSPSRTELVVAVALVLAVLAPRLVRAVAIIRNTLVFGGPKTFEALVRARQEAQIAAVPFLPFSGRRAFLVIDQDTQKQALSLPLNVADSHDAFFFLEAELCVAFAWECSS